MLGRTLILLICGAAGWAQLPPTQAPLPAPDPFESRRGKKHEELSRTAARLDAVAYDADRKPLTRLTAADFHLQAEGTAQKIDTCEYRANQPLRLAVVIDDLSLSADHSNSARRDLRKVVDGLGPNDEMAILRASAGSGVFDRFTSDKRELQAAIDRAPYNPAAEGAPPETLAGTFRTVVKGALEGMRELGGRQALLVISERLRDAGRMPTTAESVRLRSLADLASAVIYIVDMSAVANLTQLDFGVAQIATETGGLSYEGDKTAAALAQIARDQAGYYFIEYHAEGAQYDYLAGMVRVRDVKLTAANAMVRARNGVFGVPTDEESFGEIDRNLTRAAGTELLAGDLGVRVTALAAMDRQWQLNGIIHIDGAGLSFVRSLDGKYRCEVEVVIGISGDAGTTANQRLTRTVDLSQSEDSAKLTRANGLDYTVTLNVSRPGGYRLLVAARDSTSGRVGTARDSVVFAWGPQQLSMSSLIVRGSLRQNADGVAELEDMSESTSQRLFKPGRRITYGYELVNIASDADRKSAIDVRARIWRDGSLVVDGAPIPVNFEPSQTPARRVASGTLLLSQQTRPGRYIIGVTVLDKHSGRTATRYADFEVRP
jgi:VWFA-related protein